VTSCSVVVGCQRFGGPCCLHVQGELCIISGFTFHIRVDTRVSGTTKVYFLSLNRDGVAQSGWVGRLGFDSWRGSFGIFSLLHRVQTGAGAHPASFLNGYRGIFSGG
jgi:hypothetical protein